MPAARALPPPAELTAEVVELARRLIEIPSVTNCPRERLPEVFRCAGLVAELMREAGAEVRLYDQGRYPSLLIGFPRQLLAPVMLSGHLDVVEPDASDDEFSPRVEGDYLVGRGSADMKVVVASYLVWLEHRLRAGPPYPPLNLMLVGNEENGEQEPFGTPHVLEDLQQREGYRPQLMVVGERTGERGDELYGKLCTENRGVIRATVRATGVRGHSGTADASRDLVQSLMQAHQRLAQIFTQRLTLRSDDGWHSAARFPFVQAGEVGVFNITAQQGILGLELRPIPSDDVAGALQEAQACCTELGLTFVPEVQQEGVCCPADNPHLSRLVRSVEQISGQPCQMDRKLAGTSARFAPGGNAVVWGQSGLGPHAANERHFIPSIAPYIQVLDHFAELTLSEQG